MYNKSNSRRALQKVLREHTLAMTNPGLSEGEIKRGTTGEIGKVRMKANPWLAISNPGAVVEARIKVLVSAKVSQCETNVRWTTPAGSLYEVKLTVGEKGEGVWVCGCGESATATGPATCDHIAAARDQYWRLACMWNHSMDPSAAPASPTSTHVLAHCPKCSGPIVHRWLLLDPGMYEEIHLTEKEKPVDPLLFEVPFGPELAGVRGHLRDHLLKEGVGMRDNYDAFYSWGLPDPQAGPDGWVSGTITKKKGAKEFRISLLAGSVRPEPSRAPGSGPHYTGGPLGPTARTNRWKTLQGAQKFILYALYQKVTEVTHEG